MMMVFAEFERERIKERTMESRQQRASKGEWGGGVDAFGYQAVEGALVPNGAERDIVVRMFTDVAAGMPAAQVAAWLRTEGIKTRQRERNGKTVGGKWFTSDTVKAVIRNVVHKGFLVHNEQLFKGEHQAIVSEDLWERANRAIAPKADRRVLRLEEDKHGHLLKGILVCGHCGSALTPHPAGKKDASGRPYLYYACTNVAKHGAKHDCGVRSIPAKKIEELVISLLGELGKHPETIESTVGVLRESAQKEIRPLKAEIEKRTKQIKALQEREDRLAKLAADAEAGEFGAKLLGEGREIAETRKGIEQERAGLQAQVSMKEVGLIDAESVAQQLLAFHSVMGALPAEEQKEMVRFLLKEIRVNRFDPAKDQGDLGEGEIPLKIRTQRFVLNITFFSNDLFTRALRDGVKEVRNFGKMAARAGIEPATK